MLYLTLAWRWFTGHTLDGRHRTDAGWWTPATARNPHASRFHHKPRGHRAIWRTSGTLISLATITGLIVNLQATVLALSIATIGLLAWTFRRTHRAVRGRKTKRGILNPMAPALAPILGTSDMEASKMLTLKPGYQTAKDGAIGHISPLPVAFQANPMQRASVEHLIKSRLPVDVDFEWKTKQMPQSVTLLAAPTCPPMVLFTDMLEEMKNCKPGEIVFGADRRENPFIGSFLLDDPHWGFSVGSGRGKSTQLQGDAAQILHQDPLATVTGIDPKMASLTPLMGIPGVVIANDPRNIGDWDSETQHMSGGMWGAIGDVETEMMQRLDTLSADPTATFPIKLLIIDEINTFAAMTGARWRRLRIAKAGDPPVPPPWMSLASIHWMGRQVSVHCISVGQRLDDKATGGIGLRSSMGLVGIAGYRAREWDLLIGTRPMPRSQKPKGRWLYDDSSKQTWVQNMCAARSPSEAGIIIRDYASAGRFPGVRSRVSAPSPGQTPVVRTDIEVQTSPQIEWIVGLDAGADYLGISRAAFEKRRQRSGKIPGEVRQGNQPAWDPDDLVTWDQPSMSK